ncbi:MAG: hypothetical protein IPL24_12820 [Bacteroidetes bacterium]|nr:hypothetical protein [Bacteroidota bacterium]
MPVDGKLTYTITSQNGANVYAVLYDNNGTTYLAGSYTTSSVSFSKNDLAAGTYYIGIKTFYDIEFTSYTLSNSFELMTFLAEVPK